MMFPPHPTELLHTLLLAQNFTAELAIDATAGNGHDTSLLAELVGSEGRVIAFDLQKIAIETTREKLKSEGLLERVSLHHSCHTEIAKFAAPQSAKIIVFNLGYLPGADRAMTTGTERTLIALAASLEILKPNGLLAVVCYPGHTPGDEESAAVEDFFNTLPNHRTAKYSLTGTLNPAPFLLLARNGRKLSASIK
jgi:hypothetical protein